MDDKTHHEEFELSGGAVCLDLANTVGDRPVNGNEHLKGYDDLLRWSLQTELLSADQVEGLSLHAAAHPRRARAVFQRAIELREAIYRLFSAVARCQPPAPGDLETLNGELSRALPNLVVASGADGFEWMWTDTDPALDKMLWQVARSAAELLTSEEAIAVRECAASTCSWLFVDRSRGRRRKWCDMAVCGNRAKARRHYRRNRAR